tara:strand:- start:925 stop:2925 length:2001 start_codon:yes stop_codon:yes gene_type:complete
MTKKILIKGPLLSRSGYGEQARFALDSLTSRQDLFDIYVLNTNWGGTGQISDLDLRSKIDSLALKTMQYLQSGGTFDISLQVTIPNEFEKIAPVNIGYTAGIETTKVAPEWIEKCNAMVDRVVVVSEHSRKVFESTKYDVQDQNGNSVPNWGVQVPIKSVNYCVRNTDSEELDVTFQTDKNFLVVSQWGPRKNVDNTIRWFVETFSDDETVGLVLKTNIVSDSYVDREHVEKRLKHLLESYPDRKCKIYLVHGELTPGQLKTLYTHDTMQGMINIGHGEGFGLPLFEAAGVGLPLITVTWSGQNDFICTVNKKGKRYPRVVKVDYDLKPVHKSAVWKGVITEDSMWAYPKEASFKRALTDCIEKQTHYRHEAAALQSHIQKEFTVTKKHAEFVEFVYGESTTLTAVEDLPKVSVITSVYNAADFIEGFMEDITNQTIFKEKCELVLVNANPPGQNHEEDVIKQYMKKYPDNIVYERLEEDPGIYATWNRAVELATGEFITNANCDDRKSRNSLEMHAAALHNNPEVDLVYADSLITEQPNETFVNNTSQGKRYNFPEFTVENILRSNMPHNNPMWRRSYHDKYGTFDTKYRSAGDWEFWLRGAFLGAEFKKIPRVLGLYYFNPTGISTNPENAGWKREEEKEVFRKYKKMYADMQQQEQPSAGLVL